MKRMVLAGTLLLVGCAPGEEEGASTWSVRATLTEASDFPTLEEIRPYRDALIAHEYEIEGEGTKQAPRRIAVYHWAIIEEKTTRAADLKEGDTVHLEIQPVNDRPDLKGRFRKNSLDAFDLQEFFAIEWHLESPVKP